MTRYTSPTRPRTAAQGFSPCRVQFRPGQVAQRIGKNALLTFITGLSYGSQESEDEGHDIGISAADREEIVQGLSALLADSYTLYLMTHNFHWNVKGPQFNSLHNMFMTQYTEQWNALALIAERIRALGHPAPGTY